SDDDISAHSNRNQSFTSALYRLGNWCASFAGGVEFDRTSDSAALPARLTPMDGAGVRSAVRLVQICLLLLLARAGWSAARNADAWQMTSVCALGCLAMMVISPVFRGHYYVFWWPAACVVPWCVWRNGRARLAASLGISACVLTWIHYVLLDPSGRVGEL